jgi:hypothetical protein
MRNIWLFLAAITLIIFAVVGIILLSGMRQKDTPGMRQVETEEVDEGTSYSSVGEGIYHAGIGSNGRDIPYTAGPRWMRDVQERGCVNCHGTDGKGGFSLTTTSTAMASTLAPDITYDSLISEVHHHGGQAEVHEGRYTDKAIKRAITEGVNPSGEELDHMMPRWKMIDAELNELLAYLKKL